MVSDTDTTLSHLQVLYASFNSAQEKPLGISVGLRWNHFQQTSKGYLEPRLRLWYNLSKTISLHANVGKYHQFVSQLLEFRGQRAGIETPIWVLAGEEKVPVLSATQYQVGMVYHAGGWVVDVQGYRKTIDCLTSLASGFELAPREKYKLGTSSVRGIDILIKKRWNAYRTWISYSISKVDYHFDTFFDTEFPAPYDQRHNLNWTSPFEGGRF